MSTRSNIYYVGLTSEWNRLVKSEKGCHSTWVSSPSQWKESKLDEYDEDSRLEDS